MQIVYLPIRVMRQECLHLGSRPANSPTETNQYRFRKILQGSLKDGFRNAFCIVNRERRTVHCQPHPIRIFFSGQRLAGYPYPHGPGHDPYLLVTLQQTVVKIQILIVETQQAVAFLLHRSGKQIFVRAPSSKEEQQCGISFLLDKPLFHISISFCFHAFIS